jgi:hypothetical protein
VWSGRVSKKRLMRMIPTSAVKMNKAGTFVDIVERK